MRILAIVYRLGGVYPTGVTNKRVLDALKSMGHEVLVISAPTNTNTWHNECHYECSDFPTSPARLFTKMGNFIQRDLNFIFWENRVFKCAKRIIKLFQPDIIYARSSPSAVCRVAARISKHTGIPVAMHFTDPIPAPIEWASDLKYRAREIKLMETILPIAYKVSFGNKAMLEYQQSIMKYNFIDKSFISPDPSPSERFYYSKKIKNDVSTLTFLGAFHGNRRPDSLFHALYVLNQSGYKCKLNIYDDNRYGINHPECVSFMGRTDNIQKTLLDSDILVDVEGEDNTPVFISSKLKDYLCCGRPILAITVKNSPSYNLVNGLSTVKCCENKPSEIVSAIKSVLDIDFREEDYKERLVIIKQFNPTFLAKLITDEFK